jgi:hypothetical protein
MVEGLAVRRTVGCTGCEFTVTVVEAVADCPALL